MLGTTFYNESIKKALVGFGTLFNNVNIEIFITYYSIFNSLGFVLRISMIFSVKSIALTAIT